MPSRVQGLYAPRIAPIVAAATMAKKARGKVRVRLRRGDGQRAETRSVWNISLGGLFLELSEPLGFGEDLQLELELAGRSVPLVCRGFVVWSTRDSPDKGCGRIGAAVRLTDIGIAEMRAISTGVGQEL